MFTTRGGLVPAKIREAEGSTVVNFMFNPSYYEITQSVSFNTEETGGSSERTELRSVKSRELSLPDLIFDTYEDFPPVDVTTKTQGLLDMLQPLEGDGADAKPKARKVIFEWGSFSFEAYITSVKQKFTLFRQDGTPVRAVVTVTLKEYTEDLASQNPTSGGGPVQQVWRVAPGDRLDSIAATAYGDATKWRLIAEHNNIDHPLLLRPGQELGIPPAE